MNNGRLTTVTSSPTTSTSGRLKCFKAVIPAMHAQSSMLPESERKWSVRCRCQTFKA